jgi:hypothetical protein
MLSASAELNRRHQNGTGAQPGAVGKKPAHSPALPVFPPEFPEGDTFTLLLVPKLPSTCIPI